MSLLKKEWVTYWANDEVTPHERLSILREGFYKSIPGRISSRVEIMRPDSVTYDDLICFMGKKTKITIEVVE